MKPSETLPREDVDFIEERIRAKGWTKKEFYVKAAEFTKKELGKIVTEKSLEKGFLRAFSGSHRLPYYGWALIRGVLGISPDDLPSKRAENAVVPKEPSDNSPRPAPNQLSPPPPYFLGRDALIESIVGRVRTERAFLFLIWGLAGIGKSTLVSAVIERLRGPEDPVVVVDLANDPSRTHSSIMRHVIWSLAPEQANFVPEDQLAAAYFDVLNQLDVEKRRVLLVVDNAVTAEQVLPLSFPEHCLLLVTSRNKLMLPGFVNVHVGALSETDAVELLRKLGPRIGDEAPRAAQLCGCIPLALRVFAILVRNNTIFTVGEHLERLASNRQRLPEVEAVLEGSYAWLAPLSQQHLAKLSAFRGSWTSEAAAAVLECSVEETKNSLQGLVNGSLIEWQEQLGRFSLHELIRSFCARKLSNDQRFQSGLRHAEYFAEHAKPKSGSAADLKAWILRNYQELENMKRGTEWSLENRETHNGLYLSYVFFVGLEYIVGGKWEALIGSLLAMDSDVP